MNSNNYKNEAIWTPSNDFEDHYTNQLYYTLIRIIYILNIFSWFLLLYWSYSLISGFYDDSRIKVRLKAS